ncbi:unnamed protein product [Diabrotica balteata]|uniref:Ig-like domain-containing protein n=1 Tax=Diabrotica balteata TaxID=107213 RepID=A0A9P0GVV0_DIABA|nr:unnamed protein product [Diabrotica balteata]
MSVCIGINCEIYSDEYDENTVNISVPKYVKEGENVTLHCEFHPNSNIFSVKWYKKGLEFFRFEPMGNLPKVFLLPGISVDINSSSVNSVVLKNVQTELTNRYMCEVTWEAPSFYTVSDSKMMYVIGEPESELVLTVATKNTSFGASIIRAVCTTPPLTVRPNFTWFLNGDQSYYEASDIIERSGDNLNKFTSYFIRLVSQEMFMFDEANLTCEAQIGDIYTAQKSIILQNSIYSAMNYSDTEEYPVAGSPRTIASVNIFGAFLIYKLLLSF